jgi:hypothetical protein
MKTIDKIKQIRSVSDELKAHVKDTNAINRAITKTLKEGPKTIPQIAEQTDIEMRRVTYHLMTLMKYGKIMADEIDDMDEYYYYKLTG